MKRKTIFILALLSVLVLLVVYAVEMGPHNFPRSRCGTCHILDTGGRIVKGEMRASLTALCMECHTEIFTEGYMHPVDIKPKNIRVPADMPLSRYGDMTCGTCHDIHSSYLTPYGTKTNFLRRGETGRNFCIICHPDAASLRAGHRGTLDEVHFKSRYIVTGGSLEIDRMSQNCISCHDGAYASSVSIRGGYWSHGRELMRNDMGSHPIGVDYENSRIRRGRKSDLRPIGMVDRRIRFFDGKIGCGSCHDPYSGIEKQLVISDVRSKLCFSCHLLDRGA